MSGRDIGASVRQRLLNQSRAQTRPFQELLQYFAMERFLYRLSQSQFSDRFILKGALLLTAWRAPFSRPTMDIDFSGTTGNGLDHIAELVSAICEMVVDVDGIEFAQNSIEVSRIKEDAEYEGVRVKFHATLANARIPMQIDIGFGDVILPGPIDIEYPTLLDFPAPVLQSYPKQTVIAEKLEAMTVLGLLNSRLKDYYDVALLARLYSFDSIVLMDSIVATFRHRRTMVEAEPIGLTDAYAADASRSLQWRAFVRRSRFIEEPSSLEQLVTEVRNFALPLLAAVAHQNSFKACWQAGGSWELVGD